MKQITRFLFAALILAIALACASVTRAAEDTVTTPGGNTWPVLAPGNYVPLCATMPLGPGSSTTNPMPVAGVVGGTPIPVTGTFSATLGGFAPSGNYATLAVTTSTGNGALPSGSPAVVVVYNTGSNPAFVKLGTSNAVTATTGNDYIPAGGALALTVGSNTYLAAISTGGSTSLTLSGGTGLATGWGGGSGGGGGTVTQGAAASSGPWIFTPWVAGAVNSPTNGLYANLLQGNAVNASGNPIFAQLTAGAVTIGNVNQTAVTAGFSKITDGTNGPAAVKAASTAAAATDPALVVSISPNSPVNVANQSVGSAAFATAQASPGISATSIVAARTGAPGTGRIAAIIVNMSTVPVFLGGSGVTAATGSYLAGVVGAAVVIPTTAAIYGITASGTGSVSVQELY